MADATSWTSSAIIDAYFIAREKTKILPSGDVLHIPTNIYAWDRWVLERTRFVKKPLIVIMVDK